LYFYFLTSSKYISNQTWNALLTEYRNGGAVINADILAEDEHGVRGLYSNQTFQRMDTILRIPIRLGYTCDRGFCTMPLAEEIHKGTKSKFAKWFATVPTLQDFQHMFHFNMDLVKEFKFLFSKLDMRKLTVRSDFAVRYGDFYAHAAALMMTRAFDMGAATIRWKTTGKPGTTSIALGVVDMANHAHHSNAGYYISRGQFLLVAGETINPGTPITVSYGNLNNKDLALGYGFTMEENPVQIDLYTSRASCIHAQNKLKLYETRNNSRLFRDVVNEVCSRLYREL